MRSYIVLCCAGLLAVSASAVAQEPAAPPAHVSFLDGTVLLYRDGSSEPATMNMPVLEGDRLRTINGRAEVMFPDGSAIGIDPNSEIEFITGTRVRVITGAIEHIAAQRDPGSQSATNLPPDLQPYAPDLDRNGSWQYEPTYGNVWYPTVAADWRPYYYGYWSPLPTYGLTWIGYDRWSWPTHHYGRWGHARSRWFWIPGRTWSAAWVSWSTAPDYYGWCPLGFDNRPVIGLSVGYRSSWNAWTVVPRDRFLVRGASIHRYAVEPGRLAATTPFVVHRGAPVVASRGRVFSNVPAASSSVAVPRYSTGAPRSIDGAAAAPRYERRAPTYTPPSVQGRTPAYERTTPAYERRAPAYERRGPAYAPPAQSAPPAYERRAPAAPSVEAAPRSPYRPDYQPRYEPRSRPNYEAPRAAPSAPPAASAPVMRAPVMREGAPARQAPPAREMSPSRQAVPRESAPARESRGQSHGRSENGGGRRR